jgi:hypothetical protein
VTLVAGDIVKYRSEWSRRSAAYKNGVLIASTNDCDLLIRRSAGLGIFNTTASLDDWQGGNLVSGTPTPLLGNLFVGPVGFGR